MSSNSTWREQHTEELASRSAGVVFAEAFSMAVINLISTIGNLLVCFVIYKTPSLQTKTNFYVISLVSSDTLTSLFAIPLTTGTLIEGKWIFGDLLCQLQGFLLLFLSFCSLHTMALIAVNRYFCVVKHDLYRKWFQKKSLIAMLAIVWTGALMTGLTPVIVVGGFRFEPSRSSCFAYVEGEQPNMIFVSFCLFFYILLPFILMLYCYAVVFRKIREHKKNNTIHNSRSDQNVKLNQNSFGQISVEELQITKLLFALVLGFIACWVPCVAVEMVEAFLPLGKLSRSTYMTYIYLVYLSSAINPVLYGTFNRAFRRATKRMLRCGCRSNVVHVSHSKAGNVICYSHEN